MGTRAMRKTIFSKNLKYSIKGSNKILSEFYVISWKDECIMIWFRSYWL